MSAACNGPCRQRENMSVMESRRRREGGRSRRTAAHLPQLPWQPPTNPYAPMEVLSADQIEAIHATSLRILEELGIELMSARARAVLRAAGPEVDEATGTVRVARGLVAASLARTPSSIALTPRNPTKHITLGGNHINFGLVAG